MAASKEFKDLGTLKQRVLVGKIKKRMDMGFDTSVQHIAEDFKISTPLAMEIMGIIWKAEENRKKKVGQ